MTEKRAILLLASAAALALVLHESALSAPPTDKPTLPTDATTITTEPAPATSPKTTAATASEQDTTATRRTRRERPGRMTAEERNARWERRFQKMRERAMRWNREIQETTERWDSYWKTLDAMTPKQKEAIYAIFGHGQRRYAHRNMRYRTPPARPMPPRLSRPEFDSLSPRSGYDYDYAPRRMQSYPFEREPGPFFGK